MSRNEFERVIVWFRRDLRVNNNAALSAACLAANQVIPLFILDEEFLKLPDTGAASVSFLLDALRVLDRNLKKAGGRLIVLRGSAPKDLLKAAEEYDAQAVFFHREYEPNGRRRDEFVVEGLRSSGKVARSFPGLCLSEPGDILTTSSKPYTVFTPFKRKWFDDPVSLPVKSPVTINVPAEISSPEIPSEGELSIKVSQKFDCGGEDAAKELLEKFSREKVSSYEYQRDRLASNGTSKLSSHLHFGTISPSSIVHDVRNKPNAETFLSEIAWRDFYFQILFHFPYVEKACFRASLNNIHWEDDEQLFRAWCEGKTGYPIVDAAMRQLNQEAWMHNRARMIVASFLTKDLLINWQHGERHFMRHLVDGDLAANNGGWQWSAGTGTDAQPYFRIFNPTAQGERFDPDGEYVKKYVPELRKLPSAVIHSPWKLSSLEQEACGCVLGRDYPWPVVDHKVQRLRALELYKAAGEVN